MSGRQGCISCVTCSYPELTEDHVLTSACVKIFRTVTRNAVNKGGCQKRFSGFCPLRGCLKEKRLFLTSLKQICNEYLIKFSENQSAPKLENRKTSPCSPCAPNLLHVLVSRIPGYHNLCSPGGRILPGMYETRGLRGLAHQLSDLLFLHSSLTCYHWDRHQGLVFGWEGKCFPFSCLKQRCGTKNKE